jgi:DNA-binding transcriptional ArsR family regulator
LAAIFVSWTDRRLTLAVSPKAVDIGPRRFGGGAMADRLFLARLRVSGGPSHELLVLLERHRVMTSGQLARATGAPERTVRYRMERLHEAGLVDCARPGRERGSAPRHWWLRPAGSRIIAGTAPADGRPSGMFVAHAAAITEVWLALAEHGPAAGIEVRDWLTDRVGWQEWQHSGRYGSHPSRLTPDAVATLRLRGADDGDVLAFVEVDLASMTQTLLKQKVARYAAYAADRAWEGRHAHCPPMLLFTTTPTRAATFVRAAGEVLRQARESFEANDPAATLVVAACGLVREPARAVTEPCWQPPDSAAAELLADRVDAVAASAAWRYERDVVMRRRDDLAALRLAADARLLGDWLGSGRAAQALRVLAGSDPNPFLDSEPDLAGQIAGWVDARRRLGKFEARDLARPLVARLEARHTHLWADQARRLLAARAHLRAETPLAQEFAATLAAGRLASHDMMQALQTPPGRTWQQIQDGLLADYVIRRAAEIEKQLAEHRSGRRRWLATRRTTHTATARTALGDEVDRRHLLVCGTCGLAYPWATEPSAPAWCPECRGDLLDWRDRHEITHLDEHLECIRGKLRTDGRARLA